MNTPKTTLYLAGLENSHIDLSTIQLVMSLTTNLLHVKRGDKDFKKALKAFHKLTKEEPRRIGKTTCLQEHRELVRVLLQRVGVLSTTLEEDNTEDIAIVYDRRDPRMKRKLDRRLNNKAKSSYRYFGQDIMDSYNVNFDPQPGIQGNEMCRAKILVNIENMRGKELIIRHIEVPKDIIEETRHYLSQIGLVRLNTFYYDPSIYL